MAMEFLWLPWCVAARFCELTPRGRAGIGPGGRLRREGFLGVLAGGRLGAKLPCLANKKACRFGFVRSLSGHGLPGVCQCQAVNIFKVCGVASDNRQSAGQRNGCNLRVFGRDGLPLAGAHGRMCILGEKVEHARGWLWSARTHRVRPLGPRHQLNSFCSAARHTPTQKLVWAMTLGFTLLELADVHSLGRQVQTEPEP